MRDELLNDLAEAGSIDLVILGLHGATVAGNYDDCEGDLLRRVRCRVGPDVAVAALLDPHCHLTEDMLANVDLMFAYKEYPHDDIFSVADQLVDEAMRFARKEIRPVARAFDCRTLGSFNTYNRPMRDLVDELNGEVGRRSGVLDISIAHGFPWGDVADCGARVWVTTDGDPELAASRAEYYGRRLMELRDAAQTRLTSLPAAAERVRAAAGPVIIAETSDNPGGGAPSDCTNVVRFMLDAGLDRLAAGLFWDPVAVSACVTAGEGAAVSLSIGGKASSLSGAPLDIQGRVVRIAEDLNQPFGGGIWPTGRAVRIETARLTLILTSNRTQCFATEAFTDLGVDLSTKRGIIVKSSNHFESSFRKVSQMIVHVDSPGVLTSNFSALPYRNVLRPIWPLDGSPPGRPIGAV
jgi:microcystin degradation protein MlrC